METQCGKVPDTINTRIILESCRGYYKFYSVILMYRLLRLLAADPVGRAEGVYVKSVEKVPQVRIIGIYAGKVQKKVPYDLYGGT